MDEGQHQNIANKGPILLGVLTVVIIVFVLLLWSFIIMRTGKFVSPPVSPSQGGPLTREEMAKKLQELEDPELPLLTNEAEQRAILKDLEAERQKANAPSATREEMLEILKNLSNQAQ